MIKHVLVPLDGSHLGESALPPAAEIARRMGASIMLLHVIEKGAPAAIHGEHHLAGVEEAERYLEEVAHRTILADIHTEKHVHTAEVSDVARSIAEHSTEFAPDLIVMTTHGRRGPRQMIVGTVAQQVIALGSRPVLAVRPSEGEREPRAPKIEAGSLFLVPLDANPSHEKALPLATDLARAFGSRIHLVMVVPKMRNLRGPDSAAAVISPGAMRVKLDMDTERAAEYLRATAEALAQDGTPVTSECVRGDAPGAIVNLANRAKAGLIVLGTHGKAGTDAFWNDSVAARVVTRTRTAVLLVPAKES